ncbi:amino acid kinase [Methanobrevibacter sp. 87.7]|uniref:isopentenyl phosphate kinase n=1 Tax=Methanobrevibacter sp. 87.7 TaxID=387957 RepID=UPI000B4FEFB7|nr:isopentenyl phosphate kinase [Methanobrevibacter sp. 87.7]OWT33009.1 amino acid kinase [Methanobrevibacter sp. 87.7]
MIILKIGGSIITNKDSIEPEVDYDNLNRISGEIAEAYNNESLDIADGLIIVHGAGSFGHPPAKKYKIGEPFTNEEYPLKRKGFSEIVLSMKKLNLCVCESLLKQGIPVVPIQTSAVVKAYDKRINDFDLKMIKTYLKEGYVPVLYGDVVIDDKLKMSILSGDQIIEYVASFLASDRVVLGTDVDGVYDKNPKIHEDAKLIEKVSSLDDITQLESTVNVDVTGGMIGKVKELLTLADNGVDSEIINANKPGIISKCLQGEKVKGTKITKKQ